MKARVYSASAATPSEYDSGCIELHWLDGRVVQLSGREPGDPRGPGVMIRIWPENGTMEYGGSNSDACTIHLVPDGNGWRVSAMSIREPEGGPHHG